MSMRTQLLYAPDRFITAGSLNSLITGGMSVHKYTHYLVVRRKQTSNQRHEIIIIYDLSYSPGQIAIGT